MTTDAPAYWSIIQTHCLSVSGHLADLEKFTECTVMSKLHDDTDALNDVKDDQIKNTDDCVGDVLEMSKLSNTSILMEWCLKLMKLMHWMRCPSWINTKSEVMPKWNEMKLMHFFVLVVSCQLPNLLTSIDTLMFKAGEIKDVIHVSSKIV